MVDGCLVLKLSFEDFRILFRYSEQIFSNWLLPVTSWLFGSGYTLSPRVWGVKWLSHPWSGSWGVTLFQSLLYLILSPIFFFRSLSSYQFCNFLYFLSHAKNVIDRGSNSGSVTESLLVEEKTNGGHCIGPIVMMVVSLPLLPSLLS